MAEYLDEDGYPTDLALDRIAAWDPMDSAGWFEFIHQLWYLRSWGWSEVEENHEVFNRPIKRLYISTAGWSGNENIIHAMERNDALWAHHWYSSRRGGHYVFQLEDEE